jgi:hypothetical protein
MKRWALLTVFLYVSALVVLTMPVVSWAFAAWAPNPGKVTTIELYSSWWYWIWIAVLAAGQLLLLLVPVDLSRRRVSPRRSLKAATRVTAFLLANLSLAALLSLLGSLFAMEKGFEGLEKALHFITFPGVGDNGAEILRMFVMLLPFWIFWALVFGRYTRADEPSTLITRATRWLMRGSILELLIAVPSHVIVRRRDECCAPLVTSWGIGTGISVMLLCFGPGAFFLFADRFKRLKSKASQKEVDR